jgi:hypothetical protein
MKVKFELDLTTDQLIQLLTNIKDSIAGETFEKGFISNTPKQSEISKMKLFMEVFAGLSGQEHNDVKKDMLFTELRNTGRFSIDDLEKYLKMALGHGLIYERREGWYAKV